MTHSDGFLGATRMIFMGEAALADGFQLIGFETLIDPAPEVMDRLLRGLIEEQQKAFIILDERLSAANTEALRSIRAEGGRIVVTQLPPLHSPHGFHSALDQRIRHLIGGGTDHEAST